MNWQGFWMGSVVRIRYRCDWKESRPLVSVKASLSLRGSLELRRRRSVWEGRRVLQKTQQKKGMVLNVFECFTASMIVSNSRVFYNFCARRFGGLKAVLLTNLAPLSRTTTVVPVVPVLTQPYKREKRDKKIDLPIPPVRTRRRGLIPQHPLNLLHHLRRQLLHQRQRLAIIMDLLHLRRAQDHRAHILVLDAPRHRQLRLAPAEPPRDLPQLPHLLQLRLPLRRL